MSKVLLFSSGLDSFIAWHFLSKPPCLHITGHSRYSFHELVTIHGIRLHTPDMKLKIVDWRDWLKEFEEPDANIPLRNAHFAMVAAHFGNTVYMPCQRGEQEIPDRSPRFFNMISELISYLSGREVKVVPVFPDMTKQDMVSWYINQGLFKEELYHTYSCFSGEIVRCGECSACFRTAVALDYNNILPDKFFTKDIWSWEGITGYVERLKDEKYEQRRAEQTKQVLRNRNFLI